MTRFGIILFNMLLVGFIYMLVYVNGVRTAALHYALLNFSEPYMILLLIMVILSTVRWFMSHDPEIAKETVTWVHLLWIVPVMTFLAIYGMGGFAGNSWPSLHNLMTVR